ncbi:MAG: hypothetical protein ACOH2A_05580 [Sphingobacteriaceae bacterium]
MKEERISTGYTVILQAIVGSFVILLLAAIAFLLKNKSLDATAWIIICCIIIFIIILVWQLFSFADVYVSSDKLIYKKIIGIKNKPLSFIKSVKEGLLPFNYYIEFMDNKRVYFQLKPRDMLKRYSSSNADSVTKSLKKRLRLEE